jgi:hypothetical protein
MIFKAKIEFWGWGEGPAVENPDYLEIGSFL